MSDQQFFGAEAILINKTIFYIESRREGGRYTFKPDQLANAIADRLTSKDHAKSEQMIRELFWICSQGRRPWSSQAEQSFLSLASTGRELLVHLRSTGGISSGTYAFIDPLTMTLSLEREAENLKRRGYRNDNADENKIWTLTLSVFDQLTHLYIDIFALWIEDSPQDVQLPPTDQMEYLLTIGDDSKFANLLSSFARTKNPRAIRLVADYSKAEGGWKRNLAAALLEKYG